MKCYALFQTYLAKTMFGEQVGPVDFTSDLAKIDPPHAYRLLSPQRMGVQELQFARALP